MKIREGFDKPILQFTCRRGILPSRVPTSYHQLDRHHHQSDYYTVPRAATTSSRAITTQSGDIVTSTTTSPNPTPPILHTHRAQNDHDCYGRQVQPNPLFFPSPRSTSQSSVIIQKEVVRQPGYFWGFFFEDTIPWSLLEVW
ncbi:hypothetical protein PGT21_012429 [Puccinia graminis f. sp. tritici]|uniref:Uncharacterized protein n=1 Tax=Puccinia graminis f. sp. tritici TaxID=56615 RepID=A0A5B0M5Y9_PUCGR|nr:hypothetical protein PGT21_012429 [Puccinia graminis f. sp. tritici]